MGANLVKEVAVVRNNQHGVFEVAEVVFEPFDGFEVKVVGRLVEKEVVGFAEQGLRQHHAHFFVC